MDRQVMFKLGMTLGSGLSAMEYIRMRSHQELRQKLYAEKISPAVSREEENSKVREILLKAAQLAVSVQLMEEKSKS